MNREQYREAYHNAICTPEWWAKTQVVAHERGYKCEKCGKYLPRNGYVRRHQTHHSQYTAGLQPWFEDEDNLHVVCPECHAKNHGTLSQIHAPHAAMDLVNERLAYIRAASGNKEQVTKAYDFARSVRI